MVGTNDVLLNKAGAIDRDRDRWIDRWIDGEMDR
tara:strand:- start:63 stop:164 length:102 start_codon:yes stop_codon:yes gene_type:complete